MSLSTSLGTSSSTSDDLSRMPMQSFISGQCLLCSHFSRSFAGSIVHMQRTHGLFIPHQQHLIVDLETLFRYLHLVIFGYRECIHCGAEKTTVQAVQQHMTGKGHCKFDISDPDSEFAEFYDFSELPEHNTDSDIENENEYNEVSHTKTTKIESSRQTTHLTDEDSILLLSGKTILRKSPTQAEPLFTQSRRRRIRARASRLEYSIAEPDTQNNEAGDEKAGPCTEEGGKGEARSLSKREKREQAIITYQLANMSANDRNGLMHLSAPQQRSILATQHRQREKIQKEERRRQRKIDRKGNKNLYAYWATETPVYQCG